MTRYPQRQSWEVILETAADARCSPLHSHAESFMQSLLLGAASIRLSTGSAQILADVSERPTMWRAVIDEIRRLFASKCPIKRKKIE